MDYTDDMQKMIERYKRELMAMNRSAPRKTEQAPVKKIVADNSVSNVFPDNGAVREPRIVGYVADENSDSAKEKIAGIVSDNLNAEIKTAESTKLPAAEDDIMDMDESVFVFPEETSTLGEEPEAKAELPHGNEIPAVTPMPSAEKTAPEEDKVSEKTAAVPDHPPMPSTGDIVPERQSSTVPENTVPSAEGMKSDEYRNRDEPTAEGSRSIPGEFVEPVYDSYEDFLRKNSGSGTIRFNVYTASEALPIAGAKCLVTKMLSEKEHIFYTLITDISGRTPPSSLPAPSKELSQDSENKIQPFALYDAYISKEGYADVKITDIPIFDGVASIQQVQMIPVPDGKIIENITEVQDANR